MVNICRESIASPNIGVGPLKGLLHGGEVPLNDRRVVGEDPPDNGGVKEGEEGGQPGRLRPGDRLEGPNPPGDGSEGEHGGVGGADMEQCSNAQRAE